MPHRSLPLRVGLAIVLAAFLLPACGGESGEEPRTSSSDASSGPAATDTPATTRPQPAHEPGPGPATPGLERLPPSLPEPGQGIVWVEGFAKGAAQAKDEDEVLFVYVGRKSPT